MDWKLIVSALSLLLAFAGFFIGQKSGMKRNAYDEGIKDANIKNSIDNLARKIEEYAKDAVRREEFSRLEERCKSNTHRLDRLEGEKVRNSDT